MPAVARCSDCAAACPAGVCPVCQQFPPDPPRSAVLGAALLGGVAGLLTVAGWAAGLSWKWDRWREQFGDSAEPPVQADARAAAVVAGLLLFAAVSVGAGAAARR